MDMQGYIMHGRVYIATKKVFALMFSVWCVRVVPSSRAQCTKKHASSRAQCVFFTFFFLPAACKTMDKRETKKERTNSTVVHVALWVSKHSDV